MSVPLRLLLVDHETLLRRCLVGLFNRRRGFQVVGEAATAAEALEMAGELRPNVAIVDLAVPGGGPALIADLGQATADCAVLALTRGDDNDAVRALRAGARGYLLKTCEPEALVRAIERVGAGELVLTPAIVELVLKIQSNGSARTSEAGGLTERELEVLGGVVQGRTNQEIARDLFITEHTVKGHLAKIMSKLGLDNRVQVAAYAAQHGLTEPAAGPAEAASS